MSKLYIMLFRESIHAFYAQLYFRLFEKHGINGARSSCKSRFCGSPLQRLLVMPAVFGGVHEQGQETKRGDNHEKKRRNHGCRVNKTFQAQQTGSGCVHMKIESGGADSATDQHNRRKDTAERLGGFTFPYS